MNAGAVFEPTANISTSANSLSLACMCTTDQVENKSAEAQVLETEASLQGDNTFMGLDDVRFSVRPR